MFDSCRRFLLGEVSSAPSQKTSRKCRHLQFLDNHENTNTCEYLSVEPQEFTLKLHFECRLAHGYHVFGNKYKEMLI